MKKGVKLLIVVVATICVLVAIVFVGANIYSKKTIANINVQTTDINGIMDGVYMGNYEVSPVKVSVQVTVHSEKIVDIVILDHKNGLGKKAESIIQNIIEQQSLEVDTVSGATMSSIAILKAIENALEKGGDEN